MDFALSDSQRAIRDGAAEFARKHLNENWVAHDRTGEFPRGAWLRWLRWPVIRTLVDSIYDLWARRRYHRLYGKSCAVGESRQGEPQCAGLTEDS